MRLNHAVVLAGLGNLVGLAGASVVLARADCKAYKIVSGDTCDKIASTRCGNIKLDDLYSYNSGLKAKCGSLKLGDYVCCNKGTLPDMDPPANSDGTCKYYQVQANDDCWGIANTRCNPSIDVAQLYKFNGMTEANCSSLALKQPLCCSKGTKPDFRPKKNADGSCVWHEVAKGEVCGTIASANSLTVDELLKFNVGKTWGFNGCGDRLQPKQRICLSDGTPPFPSEAENKVDCGPRKQGTKPPTNGTNWADLNPCPLNVCCNTWGFCGTTPSFCIDTSIDKTPGSSKNNTNGCISNCGLDIVNNKSPPANFAKVGYFESWNPYTRPCLNMDVTQINKAGEGYTHIHFAFGNLTDDFQVSVSGVQDQWDKFVKLTGVKRVVAFGGWAFSNEPGTNHIIRNGVKPANRAKFAANIVDFVKKNNIDGVDFDWEYPGATDIDGSEPGTAEDGPNYLAFLKLMRSSLDTLGSGKTLSFAAPASFWYLKSFPIKEMSQVVDYIVYMTYDLHGQWDVGNKWAVEGCEGGNCLRSHVNKTETLYSLAMVTKAGVAANKVMVGVSSYGRSFKMAKSDCRGPDCTFLGTRSNSMAKAGTCTQTSGYIADAEIRQVMKIMDMGWSDATYVSTYDEASDSDIFIYNNDEWVAWMDVETKKRRIDLYKSLGFAGTSDWAVDLQEDYGQMADGSGSSGYNGTLDLSVECDLDKTYDGLDALNNDAGNMWAPCLAMHSVTVLQDMLSKSFDGYDAAAEGYDDLFPTYSKWIKDTMNQRIVVWMFDDKDGKKPGHTYYKCFAARGALFAKRENAKEAACDNLPGKNGDDYTFWWEVQDEDGWKKSLSAAGFDPEWIEGRTIEETDGIDNCPNPDVGCITTNTKMVNYPQRKDNIDIPNPKDVIVAAKANLTNLMDQYTIMYNDIGFDSWDGSLQDAVEVLAVPVFMLRDAIDLMGEVKELAKKINAENTKNLILKIVEAVLMLVPFVGGALGAVGKTSAALARFLTAVDVAGSAGLTIYSIIEDPAMAPVAIFAMLMGALGTPSGATYRKVAKVKADMTPELKANLGKSFKELNPKVESITGKMCSAK